MHLDARQRRDLIALLCRVAWADGVIAVEERDRLVDVMERLGHGSVTHEELARWLHEGPPRVSGTLPTEAQQLFINEAMRVISADRHVDPAEMRAMRDVVNYYFTHLDELVVG